MSYILDALKKSDQERKHGEVPGLNSFQDQPKTPIATSRILLYLLVGALLINALAIGLWLTFRQDPGTITSAAIPVESSEHSEVVTAKSPAAEPIEIKETASPAEPEPTAEATPPTASSEETSQSAELLPEELTEEEEPLEEEGAEPTLTSFAKLPADVRSDLPQLSIAAHYYAGKSSSRMASINGRIMREGQTITDGLVLEEITRKGVIFRFRDYRFSMDVFIR
ncbi:MAG: general secretion pathway protein GspB [Thermodesulfobacteriota bacterium]